MPKTVDASTPRVPQIKPTAMDQVIRFAGVVSLLLGVFCAARVGVNYLMYQDKYPTNGIFATPGFYSQREEDCLFPMGPYFEMSGQMRKPSSEEIQLEKTSQDRCLSQVREARQAAQTSDISTVGLFVFLGLGILVSHKFWLRAA